MPEVFAPVRADLAGGTLDLWPLYCFHPGSLTVNVPLQSGVRLRLHPGAAPAGMIRHRAPGRPDRVLDRDHTGQDLVAAVGFHFLPGGGFEIEVLDQPPVGSGLGGSSVLAVALAKACLAVAGRRMNSRDLVAVLKDLEAGVLAAPTGVQDYYPALLRAPLALHFGPGGERVERLAVRRRWVADHLLVVFSGLSHSSGMVNWEVYRARVDGEPGVAAGLGRIAATARECRRALLLGDASAVGEAIAAEWSARRELAPAVNPPAVDAILAAGLGAGALAGKACGAGGGGSLLFWLPPWRREAVLAATLDAAGPGAHPIS